MNFRRYSDSSQAQSAIHKEFQSIEEAYLKLGLDELKTAAEVDKLFTEGKINSQTADYLKHTIQRRTEATSKQQFECLFLNSFLESGDYWKRLFLFIGIPSIALVAINTYFIEEKHHKHLEEHPPAFTPYEHMKIRTKVKHFFNFLNIYTNFLLEILLG